jgi:hypothetical protein
LFYFLVHRALWLDVPGPELPRATDSRAQGHVGSHPDRRGPGTGLTVRARARARCRGSSAAIAGATGQARTRELVHSTRRYKANHKQAAPLLLGHRRGARQPWRGGGEAPNFYGGRNRYRVDATAREREGKEIEKVLTLTTNRSRGSARSEASRRRRNRR